MVFQENSGNLEVVNPTPGNQGKIFIHLNYIPMVTTDISQLTGECSTWKNTLRHQKSELSALKEKLQQISSSLQDKTSLQDLEHLQNQFYIQLVNVHDLKHAIREHEQVAKWEQEKNGHAADVTIALHGDLEERYQHLQQTIHQVQQEFKQFVSKI